LETHGVPFVISALEKYGGSYIRDRAVQFSSWAVQFKTARPGLYLLIHLIPSFALVSNGFVEYLAKLGLGLWFGDESKEGPTSPPGGGLQPGNEIEGDPMSESDEELLQQLIVAASNQTKEYGTGGTDVTP
jgi:hypothetical protein